MGKNNRLREALHSSIPEIVLLTGILAAAFCVHVIFLLTHGLYSDEAVYTYSAYAISRGVAPYQGIALAHPPVMYYVLAFFIKLLGPQIVLLRLTNIVLFLVSIPAVFWLSRFFLKHSQERERKYLPFLCAAVYGLYPSFFLFIPIEVPLDNILSLIVLGTVCLYVISSKTGSGKWFFVTGVLAGVALIETFRAVFFVVPFLLFHLLVSLRRKEFKRSLKKSGLMVLGIAVPIAVFLSFLFAYDTFSQFYTQNVTFQMLRPPDTLQGRLGEILFYVNFMLPLIILGVLGVINCVKTAKAKSDPLFLLLPTLYVAGFFLIAFLTNTTLKHYFYFLTPFLAILSFMAFPLLREWLFGSRLGRVKMVAFLLLFGVALQQTLSVTYTQTLPWFYQTDYNNVEYYVGKRVADLTDFNDRIWTSEGAVAFYADRLIAPPNSTSFPWHMLFEFELLTSSGLTNNEAVTGLNSFETLRIAGFVESWESNRVKVLVIIRGQGWLPYPDELLWNGLAGQEGVASYVQKNFELRYIVATTDRGQPSTVDSPYTYEIWARTNV